MEADVEVITLRDLLKFALENNISLDSPIGINENEYIQLFLKEGMYKLGGEEQLPIIVIADFEDNE